MNVKLNIDRTCHTAKPTGKQIAAIQQRLSTSQTEISLEELAALLAKGATFKPALLNGSTNDAWTSQQVFALDFDGGATIEDTLSRAQYYGILPAFGYTSFSHSEQQHKFRLIFCLPEAVDNARLRDIIQLALMRLFPACDRRCLDKARLFFGGKALIYENYSARIDVYQLIQAVCQSIREENAANATREITRFCAAAGINIINGLPDVKLCFDDEAANLTETAQPLYIYYRTCGDSVKIGLAPIHKITGDKVTYQPIKSKVTIQRQRNFDFDKLADNCLLYDEFITGSRWCYHQEVFGMATNLTNVEGGQKRLEYTIESNDCYTGSRRNLLHTIRSCTAYGYAPMRCDSFCPYADDCEHNKNMLQQVSLKRGNVRKIEDIPEITLASAEMHLYDAFMDAMAAPAGTLSLIKAPTGIGKTQLYTQADLAGTILAVPTHKLLQEVSARLKENGVEHFVAYERPPIPNPEKEAEYTRLIELGAAKSANKLIYEYAESLKANHYYSREEEALLSWLKMQKQLSKTDLPMLCTHAKLPYINNPFARKVIIDEDIVLSCLISRKTATISDLRVAARRAEGTLSDTLNSLHTLFCSALPNVVYEMPLLDFGDECSKALDFIVANSKDITSDIFGLLNADYYIVEGDNIKYIKNDADKFIKPDKAYTIMSATMSPFIYECLFGSRTVNFDDIGQVELTGYIRQYPKSFSRSDYKKNPEKFISEVRSIIGGKPAITYKMLSTNEALNIAKAKDENGKAFSLYFGATAGIDSLAGQDIAVVGTPHINNDEYILLARALGIKAKPEGQQIEYRQIRRNGWEFFFPTYIDEALAEIQIYIIESELMQAVGRARALRNNCTVYVLSNLMLPQAQLID